MNEEKVTVDLTKDELRLIYDTFEEKFKEGLMNWEELTMSGKNKTYECKEQWLLVAMYHTIINDIEKCLNCNSTIYDQKNLDDEIRNIPFKAYYRLKQGCKKI